MEVAAGTSASTDRRANRRRAHASEIEECVEMVRWMLHERVQQRSTVQSRRRAKDASRWRRCRHGTGHMPKLPRGAPWDSPAVIEIVRIVRTKRSQKQDRGRRRQKAPQVLGVRAPFIFSHALSIV